MQKSLVIDRCGDKGHYKDRCTATGLYCTHCKVKDSHNTRICQRKKEADKAQTPGKPEQKEGDDTVNADAAKLKNGKKGKKENRSRRRTANK